MTHLVWLLTKFCFWVEAVTGAVVARQAKQYFRYNSASLILFYSSIISWIYIDLKNQVKLLLVLAFWDNKYFYTPATGFTGAERIMSRPVHYTYLVWSGRIIYLESVAILAEKNLFVAVYLLTWWSDCGGYMF